MENALKPRLTSAPPFSPVLLAGMALPQAAHPVVGRVARSFAAGLWSRHRRNFDRLSDFEGARFLIDPVDLPLAFVLELASEGPEVLTVSSDEEPEDVTATIRGSFRALLDLAAGRVDGDALFFNRDLSIEGDTEAVVALRNAMDDADLDLLEEFAESFGPLARPALRVATRSVSLFQRLSEDTEVLQQAILSPLTKRLSSQEAAVDEHEARLATLEKQVRKQAARSKAAAGKEKVEAANG